MILVNFGDSQHTQQILSTADYTVNFKNQFQQLLLYNTSYITHSFSAMRKVENEMNKNASPRTAPAMSCSRLKSDRWSAPQFSCHSLHSSLIK